MRDGVILRADVIRPAEVGRFPTLVYRTPYGKDAARIEYTTFKNAVARGYAVVIEDVRGRYHSDGKFRPYENEGKDGYVDWLSHPPEDPWWNWCELRDKYARTQAAVLNFSAWYDDNYGPEGATTNYLSLLKARSAEDRRTHLLLGPWVHGVDSTGKTHSGEREFGAAAAINYDEVVLRWMDQYLKGIDNGVDREKPVRHFVMGADQWRDSDVWPPPARQTPLFLSAENSALVLSRQVPQGRAYSEFESDPAHPVVNDYSTSGAHDYRELATRKDVLTFDSDVLDRDTEVTGPIRERIFASCDCRDFDLIARVLDVATDGAALNLMSPGLDVLRASYRDLSDGRQLLRPGEVYELRLDHLITSNVFRKGHRIRVQISASFFPNFSRNLQTGKSEVESSETTRATVRIYHSGKYSSEVILPVIEGQR